MKELEKKTEVQENELLQQDVRIKLSSLSETDVDLLNAFHDPQYREVITSLLKGDE